MHKPQESRRTFTAVVKETRVYSVFYSPKYTKCLAAVYLPINKELIAASVINLDSAGGRNILFGKICLGNRSMRSRNSIGRSIS